MSRVPALVMWYFFVFLKKIDNYMAVGVIKLQSLKLNQHVLYVDFVRFSSLGWYNDGWSALSLLNVVTMQTLMTRIHL